MRRRTPGSVMQRGQHVADLGRECAAGDSRSLPRGSAWRAAPTKSPRKSCRSAAPCGASQCLGTSAAKTARVASGSPGLTSSTPQDGKAVERARPSRRGLRSARARLSGRRTSEPSWRARSAASSCDRAPPLARAISAMRRLHRQSRRRSRPRRGGVLTKRKRPSASRSTNSEHDGRP